MSDDQSDNSNLQGDDISADIAPQSIADDVTPKKKNVLVRIYQSPRSKILLAVFALLMIGVGFVASQKVQNNKSRASVDSYNYCQNNCYQRYVYCSSLLRGRPISDGSRNYTREEANAACSPAKDTCNFACRSTGGRGSDSSGGGSTGSSYDAAAAAAARAAEEARVRAEWIKAVAYATELKKQQEYTAAAAYACSVAASVKPKVTWLSTQGGRTTIQPGTKKIKFQVGAKQDGAIIFIDDKATPWSGSCNDLNAGDKCLVPDDKGKNKRSDGTPILTQTTYRGFEAGHQYGVWVKGMSCGMLSPDSTKLNISVVTPTPAGGVSGTPAVSTTPAVSPTGTNTQQQGEL